jgi:hypothetical protein
MARGLVWTSPPVLGDWLFTSDLHCTGFRNAADAFSCSGMGAGVSTVCMHA